jgi:transposase InsO family protein
MTTARRGFVEAEKQAGHNVVKACDLLGVSRSAFYDSLGRGPCERHRRDGELTETITQLHRRSRGIYGSPRIHADLTAAGVRVSRKRVARLMTAAGLAGVCRRRTRRTTIAGAEARAVNVIDRVFGLGNWELDRAWCGDITYIRTWQGWAYLATVIDLASRRVVGWAMADHMEAFLVTDALRMAITARRPAPGLIFHADRGSQYTSHDFRRLLAERRMVQSLSRPGQCWDNSVAESWFATYKTELVYRGVWPTITQLRTATFDYIEIFYNRQRRHSTLGGISPAHYETLHQPPITQAA